MTISAGLQRLLKVIGYFVVGILALALIGLAYIYLASEAALSHTYQATGHPVSVPATPDAVARGKRLAAIRGCTGCHGRQAQGNLLIDEPWLARIVTPNLTQSVRTRTDAELETIIRQGIFPDGRSALGMPSAMFHYLSDRDLGDILAFLHSLPLTDGPDREMSLGLLARIGIVMGKYKVQAEVIDYAKPRKPIDRTDPLAYGRYLAKTSCTECHGADFTGSAATGAPPLAIVAAYSEADFRHLMRTGEPIGGRKLNLMAEVAQGRFRHFTDAEIHALHTFLLNRASTPRQSSRQK